MFPPNDEVYWLVTPPQDPLHSCLVPDTVPVAPCVHIGWCKISGNYEINYGAGGPMRMFRTPKIEYFAFERRPSGVFIRIRAGDWGEQKRCTPGWPCRQPDIDTTAHPGISPRTSDSGRTWPLPGRRYDLSLLRMVEKGGTFSSRPRKMGTQGNFHSSLALAMAGSPSDPARCFLEKFKRQIERVLASDEPSRGKKRRTSTQRGS
jgi:hypothetical protein